MIAKPVTIAVADATRASRSDNFHGLLSCRGGGARGACPGSKVSMMIVVCGDHGRSHPRTARGQSVIPAALASITIRAILITLG